MCAYKQALYNYDTAAVACRMGGGGSSERLLRSSAGHPPDIYMDVSIPIQNIVLKDNYRLYCGWSGASSQGIL